MIIDLIQHFKEDLTKKQIEDIPVYFIDIRTIRVVYVMINSDHPHIINLAIDNLALYFCNKANAIRAAKTLINLVSEARETDRLDVASLNASQAGKAMKTVIKDIKE